MDFVFYTATEDNVDLLTETDAVCFPGDPWGSVTVRSMITGKNSEFLVFCDKDTEKAVGYVVYGVYGDEGELYKIAVLPEARRRGLGGVMMQEMLTGAAKRGARRIFLEVREGNSGAVALYKKCRFVLDGVRKNYYKNPTENAILMSLDLNERQ